MPSDYFLKHTVTLQRPTATKDAAGGPVRTWANVTGSVSIACSIQPLSTYVVALYGARNIQVSHAIYTNTSLVFQRGDRIFSGEGKYFSVNGELDQVGGGQVYKYLCQETLA